MANEMWIFGVLLSACVALGFGSHVVIETDVQPELEVVEVIDGSDAESNPPIKLRCRESAFKTPSRVVDDIVWEFKRCGQGLSLTPCEDVLKDDWQVALCRNKSKLCTGATLPILSPSEADSGLYRCLHKNYMMPQFKINRVIQLQVNDLRSPSIELVPEELIHDNQTVHENQTVSLRCRVRSVEYPYILWARVAPNFDFSLFSDMSLPFDGTLYQLLNVSKTHDGPNKVFTSKLHIQRATVSDSGNYICMAFDSSNRKVSKRVSLTVLQKYSLNDISGSSGNEIWWILVVVLLSATSCILILCFVYQQSRVNLLDSHEPHNKRTSNQSAGSPW